MYEAKTVLFARLGALTAVGQPLEGVQVGYAAPGNFEQRCVYGGGTRFAQQDAVAESLVLLDEVALLSVYVRVLYSPPVEVWESDAEAARIGAAICTALAANPSLGAGLKFVGMPQGQGDYSSTDEETVSILAYQVRVESQLTYGAP
jgi:hypothetical protein